VKLETLPLMSQHRAISASRHGAPKQRSLAGNPSFESFLSRLSSAFVTLPEGDIDRTVEIWLRNLTEFVGVDLGGFWELPRDRHGLSRRYFYSSREIADPDHALTSAQYTWLSDQYSRGNVVVWSRIPRDIPASAVKERKWAYATGIRSALGIPVLAGADIWVLTLMSATRQRRWPNALVNRLKLVAEIFATAILRHAAEVAARGANERVEALLRAFPDTAFLDPQSAFPGDATILRSAATRAAKSPEVIRTEYQQRAGDEIHELEACFVKRADDGSVMGITRDVTARKHAERLLRESEERFRGAFDHSSIGIAVVSPDGRWVRANAALTAILGYSEADLRATTFPALSHPDDRSATLELLQRALTGEINRYELETRYVHKDGRTVSVLLTVSLVRDVNARPLHLICQIQDLTERVRADAEIDVLRHTLAHSSRVALMGQLTASLAHELLQPLTAVLGTAEAAQALVESGKAASSELLEYLTDIVESGNRAALLIERVRGLLRRDHRPRTRVDLNEVVRQIAQVMQNDLLTRRVRLVMRLTPQRAEVFGDPVELQQVVLNLLMNGAEALTAGMLENRELVISTAAGPHQVELKVRDSGIGIEPKHLERMFEPFFSTKPQGMGMGLAICSTIARTHRGRLWAENNSDAGMTLHLELPVDRGPTESRVPLRIVTSR
jgi:two-component system sensor kinase FixL